uniref:Uncharacterized protein n=1 Tax=Myoviridae sp. ctdNl2 TaxID=2825140 RepID=A0A8S5QFX2_9CAUD|nr:MAG TPA: hypothetical protein [Myoviridae sp. ctdNl2]
MSTMFFKHEKISAEDYVSVVRHMYVFKTMIHLYNNTFFIKVTDDGLEYSSENGLSLDMIDYMSDVVIDKDLLLRYAKSLKYEDKVNVLEVLQSLYNTISFSIVDYEELSKAFLHTNIAPNFVYIREFKSQTTYEKLKLITMCQELINYLDRYDDEEMVVPYYDCQSDIVSYSIMYLNRDAIRFNKIPLHGNDVFDRLLPVVAFSGSYGISVKQVVDNTNAVIQYLIRLYNEAVDGSYNVLKRDVLCDSSLGYNKAIEYVSEYNTKKDTDTTKYCKVSNGFIRDCLVYFKDLKSVRLFVEAIDTHLDTLNRPISDSFCTTASAIYGNIKLKYEDDNNGIDTSKVDSVVSTLLKLTGVNGGLPHIHQSAYMYLIDGSYMDTDFIDNLEVMLYQMDTYLESGTVRVEFYGGSDNTIRVFGDGIDELYDMSDYIDCDSVRGIITLKEVLDVLWFSLRVVKVFYHTWKSDDTVFVDAVNGLKVISSLQEEKLHYVSTFFNYSVIESLRFNTEMVGYFNDDLLMYGDSIIPNSCRYTNEELRKADFMYNIVKTRALGLCTILNSIAHEMFFNREAYSKSSYITMTTNKEFNTLYVKADGIEERKITIPKEFYHTVYALFNHSDYSFENITFSDVIHILCTLKDAIGNSSKFTGFYGVMGFSSLKDKLDLLTDYIGKNRGTIEGNESTTMTKELARTFIESGYEYISLYKGVMIVYSKDGNTSEIVPKSLYKFFYDTDKFNRVSLQQYIED